MCRARRGSGRLKADLDDRQGLCDFIEPGGRCSGAADEESRENPAHQAVPGQVNGQSAVCLIPVEHLNPPGNQPPLSYADVYSRLGPYVTYPLAARSVRGHDQVTVGRRMSDHPEDGVPRKARHSTFVYQQEVALS